MTAPVVTVVTPDAAETEPVVIQPVIVENPAVMEMASDMGELKARLMQLEIENSELRNRTEVAVATAEVAGDIAESAAETASAAIIVAEIAMEEPEPEPEPEPEMQPDKSPHKQHWAFREKDEWGKQ